MGCTPCSTYTKPRAIYFKESSSRGLIISSQDDLKIDTYLFCRLKKGNIRDNYTIGRKLGAGSFGFVREAIHKGTGYKRAIKTIHKETLTEDMKAHSRFFAEVDILSRADHPNIVKLYEFYEDDRYYHLVTEYIGGGELFDFIIKTKLLSEPIAANFMKQIFSGLAYCHSNNIVHRDIKPENLLLDREARDSVLKIIDFGTSANINGKLTQKYGTGYYIAPEVLRQNYDEKCDVWSCGVILYILLSGRPPFYGKDEKEIFPKIEKGEFSLKGGVWERISSSAKNLIRNLLEFNPKNRISAKEALEDQWIQRYPEYSFNDEMIPDTTLDRLYNFRAERKLQHAVLTYIASQFITKEESENLAIAFKKIDKNFDGKLSREELEQAYKELYGEKTAAEEAEKVMKQVDINNSGFIDYTEFLAASAKKEALLTSENLDSAFKTFDVDGNGKISSAELKEILGNGLSTSEEVWEEIIREVDIDGDGEIDLEEFKIMMNKIANSK
jgi:calcium-dependent protein kinase